MRDIDPKQLQIGDCFQASTMAHTLVMENGVISSYPQRTEQFMMLSKPIAILDKNGVPGALPLPLKPASVFYVLNLSIRSEMWFFSDFWHQYLSIDFFEISKEIVA
ncbi:hypothetical protein [Shewanella algae]|uniref:hypothetical protein n=1 Tax=Shewanella algae TaxID=38313 RepID=UPI0031F4DCEA